MMRFSFSRRLVAECLGTALLLATVVGSGIMAERLAGGNVALALLGNTIPTGAILFVLITMLGPVSGAHFNPAVTLAFWMRREIKLNEALAYVGVQIIGAIMGTLVAHAMFEEFLLQISANIRNGPAQWLSEGVATFGLVATILGTLRWRPEAVPTAVGLYITAAYWFTASTSFANPAVTIARSLTDTFSGIAPENAPGFILMQIVGAAVATGLMAWLLRPSASDTQ
ncbi:MAG: aquaporin family protein [Gammaproteobacteria bacterium]|jgi:glycerol uptake facilitator-like aquaporin|nr:aquaporin family protein [Gammaproteobacteria bacterium]NDA14341.1 aquaporin family protein [Gammaproteobacteria bacterium]NDG44042.1 aquaporin family protein [Gammaproteobacteria bacterium]